MTTAVGVSPSDYAESFGLALQVEDLGRARTAQTDGGVLGASDAGQCGVPRAKFWRYVVRKMEYAENGCLTWSGARDRAGYGRGNVEGQNFHAHRKVYELLVGPIPDGLTIDHLCRNTSCVNPFHLEPVTLAENIRRARVLDVCARGHQRTEDNLGVVGHNGGRPCLACRRLRARTLRAERRAAR